MLNNKQGARRCLDLWILALLLHPHETHNLWRTCCFYLWRTWSRLNDEHSDWVAGYLDEENLDSRLRRPSQDRIFEALKYSYVDVIYYKGNYIRKIVQQEKQRQEEKRAGKYS